MNRESFSLTCLPSFFDLLDSKGSSINSFLNCKGEGMFRLEFRLSLKHLKGKRKRKKESFEFTYS